PPRFVGVLLGGEAAGDRRPRVEGPAPGDAARTQRPASVIERLDGGRVCLRARLESGERSLEQQLIADRVLDTEIEKDPRAAAQPLDRITRRRRFVQPA